MLEELPIAGLDEALNQPSNLPIHDQFVYMVCPLDVSRVKIGLAKNPKERLASLQTANAELLVCIACFPGGRELEANLHEHFKASHIRGEWFDYHPDMGRIIHRAFRSATNLSWDEAQKMGQEAFDLHLRAHIDQGAVEYMQALEQAA